MQKIHLNICILIIALLLDSIILEATNSNPLPKEYICFKTDQIILIDGIINDSPWNKAEWTDHFIDIEGTDKPLPEFVTKLKMLWDDSCLYIAAYIEEPHIWGTLTERESIIYTDNDFEVFIDPDDDGKNYFELEINALGTEWDLMLTKAYNKKGRPIVSWDIQGLKTKVKIFGTINNPTDTDSAWTIEMAIPWESLLEQSKNTAIPVNGDSWRINFSRVQWETEITNNKYIKKKDPETGNTLPENNWVWSPQGAINMHLPEKWGYVHFSDSLIKATPKFWIWMNPGKDFENKNWDSTFKRLSSVGIKGILMSAAKEHFEKLIPIAEKYNIEIHVWYWTMNRGDAKKEWLSVNRNGESLADKKAYVGYYKFMCPALPEVKKYLLKKTGDLAGIKGIKGIHMDYIRYVDAILPTGLQPKYGLKQDSVFAEFDYGYHPFMRKIFKEEFGYDPLDSADPGNNQEWLNFRLDQLTKTVDLINTNIRLKGFISSAAVFPTPAMSTEMVRQPWDKWHLNYYFPMVYHNFYEKDISWITEIMQENKSTMPKNVKIFCGLYLPALKNGNDLSKAIQAAFDGGADGVALFEFNALNEGLLEQIREANKKY